MEFYNYAIGESTEPGSTFKLPALIAAMEDGYVDINDSIDTGNGEVYFYDKRVRDDSYGKGGYGKISVKRAFEVSSNVGVASIINNAYKGREHHFIDRLYSMGLNDKLGIQIRGEGTPDIKYPNDKLWSGISLPMISHGYEVRLTPLQILAFYNAIANDGKLVRPRLVKELHYHGKVVKRFPTEVINPSICSKSTLRKSREMLEGVVENGTARNLRNDYLKIAGKTGTTQMYNATHGYQSKKYQASFAGYFPADNPKYSCIVVINSPSNHLYYGSDVAGPVFLEIAEKVYATDFELHQNKQIAETEANMLPYSKNGYEPEIEEVLKELNIKVKPAAGNPQWVVTTKEEEAINLDVRSVKPNLVPNVISMGAKDAVYLLERAGLKVEIVGRGSVKNQSIAPGTIVVKGQKVVLEMSFI